MRRFLAGLLSIVALGGGLVGCTSQGLQERGMTSNEATQSPPDQSLVNEALRFGEIDLPPGARVLGVHAEGAMDTLYILVVAVEDGTVDDLLSASGFDGPLQPGRQVFMPSVTGFDPPTSGSFASAQDRLPAEDGNGPQVTREVLVDRTDPAHPRVYIWAFST